MRTEKLIAVKEFCLNHKIEFSFVISLQKTGLIEITRIKGSAFIDTEQLKLLEKFILFYYELDINIEGIETISHLLHRISSMHKIVLSLRNKLRLYESQI